MVYFGVLMSIEMPSEVLRGVTTKPTDPWGISDGTMIDELATCEIGGVGGRYRDGVRLGW
jgi:hypothetical protein